MITLPDLVALATRVMGWQQVEDLKDLAAPELPCFWVNGQSILYSVPGQAFMKCWHPDDNWGDAMALFERLPGITELIHTERGYWCGCGGFYPYCSDGPGFSHTGTAGKGPLAVCKCALMLANGRAELPVGLA